MGAVKGWEHSWLCELRNGNIADERPASGEHWQTPVNCNNPHYRSELQLATALVFSIVYDKIMVCQFPTCQLIPIFIQGDVVLRDITPMTSVSE